MARPIITQEQAVVCRCFIHSEGDGHEQAAAAESPSESGLQYHERIASASWTAGTAAAAAGGHYEAR